MEENGAQNLQYVRCLKCSKIINCGRHDTSKLIEHIRNEHPEVTVVESGIGNGTCSSISNKPVSDEKLKGGSATVAANGPTNKSIGARCGAPRPPPSCQRRHLFRTSLERWKPANGTIFCPFCCCKKQPLVKLRNERLSGSSCLANCLLACWPLCFLPFLLPGTDREYLYCANCKCFLGLYDRGTNCVKPNRQFAERMKAKQQK